jgi:hypothetical protein
MGGQEKRSFFSKFILNHWLTGAYVTEDRDRPGPFQDRRQAMFFEVS